jgi:glycosidase
MGSTGWFKKSIIYHILIDRFSGFTSADNWDKPDFLGGNIKGITQKLDYLKKLGVNTIWISPFYKTSAYHGYHVTDFYEVDSRFGTKKDLQDMIDKVHDMDMHIIADFVPNHCSKMHPFFKDASENKESPYHNWFYFTRWPYKYLCFLSVTDIPKLNLENPEVQEHVINAAKQWLSMGFDGFRLDHCIGPSHRFWKNFKKQVKAEKPECVLIGEAWMMGISFSELKTINLRWKFFKWLFGASSEALFKEYIGELDGVLDFKVQEIFREHIARNPDFFDMENMNYKISNHYRKYPDDYFLPSFLDNHDMDRFLFESNNDKNRLKKAAEIQFSLSQPPIIYYGTEIGMTQKKSVWATPAYGDIQARQPMRWSKKSGDIFSFYQELIRKRKQKLNST